MAGELRNFISDDVAVTWALPTGAVSLTAGLIEGASAIVESKDGPRSTRKRDRQGNHTRNMKGPRGGTLSLTYVADAVTHSVLTPVIVADDATKTQVGTLTVEDLNTGSVILYLGAHIEDDPSVQYGDEAGDQTYVFGYSQRIANLQGAEAL